MSGTRELKQLILMIDEHRLNIGNSQYAFPMDSEAREVLDQFSKAIPRIRREAFRRIGILWRDILPDVRRTQNVIEPTQDYVWSVVYTLRYYNTCNEESFRLLIKDLQKDFIQEVNTMTLFHPTILERTKLCGLLQFQQEEEALALWYSQKKEIAKQAKSE